jgi:hypothetical protein
MSPRIRAASFAGAAALCAGLAAAATGAGTGESGGYGPLREVVVAARPLAAHARLSSKAAEGALEVRRVPERFVPPDALASPAQAVGRSPAVPVPPGGYLLASQLGTGEAPAGRRDSLPAGVARVEIAVQGAGALARRRAARVDVVVTSEAVGLRNGRTYVAAPAVELLDLRAGPNETWVATLALTRPQALRLIEAESFARSIRLLER